VLRLLTDCEGGDVASNEVQPLACLVEKPDVETAVQVIAEGGHLWNAGKFLATASTLIVACEVHAAEILSVVRSALSGTKSDLGFTRLDSEIWSELRDISIDYAVMEKAKKNLVVMP
jgi:mannose-1-phosphate guanylyltransferase/mannose-6-phosphate isomerase